ncbi:MAG: hypothetical protein J5517_08390 [Eubacterium sp.]|nr:hypothetical protein [Eubacterium sp.]
MKMNNTKFLDVFRKRHNLTSLILCAAGVGVNLLLSFIATEYGLSIYLDTVGTVAVAIMGGYLPGVIVGFTTSIIRSFSNPTSLYYGVLNVIIAVLSTFLANRRWHKKWFGVIGMIIIFTLVGGGISAIIPWFMDGLTYDSETLSGVLYDAGYFNLEMSNLISCLITDFPDELITVLIVLVILRIIPPEYYKHTALAQGTAKLAAITDGQTKIYVALTGDQVALTDIRIL